MTPPPPTDPFAPPAAPPQSYAPVPYGPPPGYAPPPAYGPPLGYGPPAWLQTSPVEQLRRAAAAVRQVPYLMWSLLVPFALLGVEGVLLLAAGDVSRFSEAVGRAESVGDLATFAYLVVAVWSWAVLGCYCSRTSQAARTAGNLPSGKSLSGLAWGGVFIPTGIVWAPFLAYRTAVRYTLAVARHGRLTGAGEGWRAQALPRAFGRWWSAFVNTTLAYLLAESLLGGGETVVAGVFFLLAAGSGAATAVLGARTWDEVATAATRGAA